MGERVNELTVASPKKRRLLYSCSVLWKTSPPSFIDCARGNVSITNTRHGRDIVFMHLSAALGPRRGVRIFRVPLIVFERVEFCFVNFHAYTAIAFTTRLRYGEYAFATCSRRLSRTCAYCTTRSHNYIT